MNCCQLPGHAIITLFGAVAMNKHLLHLRAYDHAQLEGHDLECLIELIPNMSSLVRFVCQLGLYRSIRLGCVSSEYKYPPFIID
jgi:hypothetical protein